MSTQLQGIDLTAVSTTATHVIGQLYKDEYGREFIYGQMNGAHTAGRWSIMSQDEAYDFTPMTTALVGTPGTNWKIGGVACASGSDNQYGWFWVGYGFFECIVENNYAAGDVIYSTANAGIPGTNSSSAILDGVKTIDAGVTGTRVTVYAAGRITYGLTAVHD
jgi:hypothetical protein